MGTIQQIFSTYGPEYISRFSHAMQKEHRKVIHAVMHCRSEEYGLTVYTCQACGKPHAVFRSCGNRHCPTCQNHKTRQWLEKQLERLVPTHHFMVTFTVPKQLRHFIRSHQRIGYEAMFRASSSTLKTLATNKRFIGGDVPGFTGVLHTWGRQLTFHPHIHYIVTGGAFSTEDGTWHPSRVDFLVPVRALSELFRQRFKEEMKKAGVYDLIDREVWGIEWNVNAEPSPRGEHGMRYLAPYVFKVAISDSRIVRVENHTVTFRYKKPKSERWRTMCLDAMEFIRRFLQHVLPTGFMKVRHYGFMHPSSSVALKDIILIIDIASGFTAVISRSEEPEPSPYPVCPSCGGRLVYCYSVLPFQMKRVVDSS